MIDQGVEIWIERASSELAHPGWRWDALPPAERKRRIAACSKQGTDA